MWIIYFFVCVAESIIEQDFNKELMDWIGKAWLKSKNLSFTDILYKSQS